MSDRVTAVDSRQLDATRRYRAVLRALRDLKRATSRGIADRIGLAVDAVQYQLGKLVAEGKARRGLKEGPFVTYHAVEGPKGGKQ